MRLQIIRAMVPTLGATALVLTAYTVLSAQSQMKSTVISTQSAAENSDISLPAAEVKINGAPVELDTNGNANITTDNGASVRINTQSTPENAQPSSEAGTAQTNISVIHGTTGVSGNVDATVNHEESTTVKIFGDSRTRTRTESNTSVQSSGDGLIEIHQSN